MSRKHVFLRSFELTAKKEMFFAILYRVGLVVWQLGWVDLDLGSSPGVCCIKSYVSKRKKRGYEFRGLVSFAGKLHHENPGKRTNPQIHTHAS